MEHNLELHSLMTDMQIAYYMSLEYNGTKVVNQRAALGVMRDIAKSAIVRKRIPRSLYMYAKVFHVSENPMAVVEKAYEIYREKNPDEVKSDGTLDMQA